MIGSVMRRKNLFVLDIWAPPGRAMLSKKRDRPTYLLSKNLQIRLGYQQLGFTSNTRVVEVFKPTDGIHITIKES